MVYSSCCLVLAQLAAGAVAFSFQVVERDEARRRELMQ